MPLPLPPKISCLFARPAAFVLALGFLAAAPAARAYCVGENLFNALPAEEQVQLRASADAQPYARGNFWRASRDGHEITILGTYHLDDPRHETAMAMARPLVAGAGRLLVEGGPKEEEALKAAMIADPSLMIVTSGPTLRERVPAEIWSQMSDAFRERQMPAALGAKLRPWYAAMILGIAPCQIMEMAGSRPRGLDARLIELAEDSGVTIEALEPFDTLFKLFKDLTPEQEIDMLESALATQPLADDLGVTLADLYFQGEARLLWDLSVKLALDMPPEGTSRDQILSDMAMAEDLMMVQRNRAWIPVIEAAAGEKPIVVAFGALHLSGKDGVLQLLADRGWQIEPLQP